MSTSIQNLDDCSFPGRCPTCGQIFLLGLIAEWCEAQNQWHEDLITPLKGHAPVGFPRTATRDRLYRAGRALFGAVGVEPHSHGVYFFNSEIERKNRNGEGKEAEKREAGF